MSEAKEIQKGFLDRVKATLPMHTSLVDELADLLNTSNDSAYRRMRGETLLSIDEIARICVHFKVPFETNSQVNAQSVSFNYFKLEGKKENFKTWLTSLCDNVKQIGQVKGSDILYAADDVPIWHHFHNVDLAAFKIFYWLKSIVNDPYYADQKFDPSIIDPEYIEAAKQLLDNYNQIHSTEIWSEDTLNSTLKQVEYFWESGFFKSKEDALKICDAIEIEVDLIKTKAERETKLVAANSNNEPNFKLYRCEVMIGNNSIIANLGNSKIAYVSNNTFNMMSTTSPDFVEENERWLKNLIRQSVLISGVSEKQRNQFFKILKGKIDALKNSIQ